MEQFASETAAFGFTLSDQQVNRFARYQTLLQDWNRRINLTAVVDPLEVQRRHFLDSLSCATVTGELNGRSLIDVGTGAGFPGLPLKILYPDLRLTLVESVTKKTRFLAAVVDALGLSKVTILAERAEVVGQNADHRGRYDWAVARAVAALPVLAEYLLPLCRVAGHVLAQKGKQVPMELTEAETAVSLLGGGEPVLHPIMLPGKTEPAYLVLIPKVAVTPAKYPRRAGMPAKRPL